MINHIPDEVLLEIFDSYRQAIDSYDHQWRKRHMWISLTHVCRKWRAVVFASASRLDLGITVGPEKPDHIKTILSGPLPISIDYRHMYKNITDSALWRIHAALRHHDRVREISFEGTGANFDKFIKATNCPFPSLESLVLHFRYCYESKLPDTFLRGPNLSDLHLRRLGLKHVSLTSISGFLLSATALADLSLVIDTAFNPSSETSLLACLQGMPSLCHLNLTISSESPSQPSIPKDIVLLSKLIRFRYGGHSVFLDTLMAGLSAPSLNYVGIRLSDEIWPPSVHLPRFINEMKERYHAVHVYFKNRGFRLLLLTRSECINQHMPGVKLGPFLRRSSDSTIRMSCALSMKFTTVEELRLAFDNTDDDLSENFIAWRTFLQQFPSLKTIETDDADNYSIARILDQDHGNPHELSFLPVLEEIDLGQQPFHESQRGPELAAFESFVSARQQAGRPVKVFFSR
ncbi:hypothetical protein DFH94DRAFT_334845 [Russula ochroleuca]|uniref:F-box domain-containing protein n=1 Tax=Russula ochroleuca TaxID=152965 RepID=A0A9P5N1T7_9AGAM|nr:hypothetical protein DFH94DRAFT_334845 [Russula ochroleuca]